MRSRDRLVIVIGCRAHAGESPPVDRGDFFNRRATATPFAIEDARVYVRENQFIEQRFHVLAIAHYADVSHLSLPKGERRITLRSFSTPAELAHQLHRLINYLRGNVERRTESNRVLAGTKCENTEGEKAVPKLFAGFRVRQIASEELSRTARGGN